MFSVVLYMLKQTADNGARILLFPPFLPSYCDVSQARSYFAFTKSRHPLLGTRLTPIFKGKKYTCLKCNEQVKKCMRSVTLVALARHGEE
jgi:hypothetical protein